ncbi:MAG: hypothetical protein J6R94_03855, partial [Agathobacter sp.]|nr:hypothetical protein [Agathobacter sp.]
FIFILGYFAKFRPMKILLHWVVPYLVLQMVYILFANYVLGEKLEYQFHTPYWILWYLMAGVVYQLIIPIINWGNKFLHGVFLLASIVGALVAGYNTSIGYKWSISRILVFLPWFILGYYARKYKVLDQLKFQRVRTSIVGVIALALGVASGLCIYRNKVSNLLLWASFNYERCKSSMWLRLILMAVALIWLIFWICFGKLLLSRRVPLLTMIGKNTLPVFLLHGFVVKAIPVYAPEFLSSPWYILGITVIMMLVFGNPICKRIFIWK